MNILGLYDNTFVTEVLPLDGTVTHFPRYLSERRVWDSSNDESSSYKLSELKVMIKIDNH